MGFGDSFDKLEGFLERHPHLYVFKIVRAVEYMIIVVLLGLAVFYGALLANVGNRLLVIFIFLFACAVAFISFIIDIAEFERRWRKHYGMSFERSVKEKTIDKVIPDDNDKRWF